MVRWLLWGLGSLLLLVAAVVVTGWSLPRNHVASAQVDLRQPPEAVWNALTDFASQPGWRSGLKGMTRQPDRGSHPVWREEGSFGPLTYEVTELHPPARMVTTIADPDLPFGGSWTYEVEATTDGCRVTITERGEVRNPIFRFLSRFVFGHHATAEAYLRDLARKFGDDAAPERVAPVG